MLSISGNYFTVENRVLSSLEDTKWIGYCQTLFLVFKYHGKNLELLCKWIELHNSEDMGKTERFSEFPLLREKKIKIVIKNCYYN